MKKSTLFTILRAVVSVTLIGVLLYVMRGNLKDVAGVFKRIRVEVFVLSAVTFFCAIVLSSQRLRLITRAQEVHLTIREALNLTFIGYFFNNFLPTSIGGDVVKAYYVSRKGGTKVAAFASVFLDRFLGLFTMMLMAGVAIIFLKGFVLGRVAIVMAAVVVASVGFFVFLFHKPFALKFSVFLKLVRPLESAFRNLYNAIHNYRSNRAVLMNAVILSIASQCVYFYSIMLLSYCVGEQMPLKELFIRVPLVSAFSLLPSINGLGVREGAMVFLFGPLVGKENAFAMSLLMLVTLLSMSLIGGVVYAFSPQFRAAAALSKKEGATLVPEGVVGPEEGQVN